MNGRPWFSSSCFFLSAILLVLLELLMRVHVDGTLLSQFSVLELVFMTSCLIPHPWYNCPKPSAIMLIVKSSEYTIPRGKKTLYIELFLRYTSLSPGTLNLAKSFKTPTHHEFSFSSHAKLKKKTSTVNHLSFFFLTLVV